LKKSMYNVHRKQV